MDINNEHIPVLSCIESGRRLRSWFILRRQWNLMNLWRLPPELILVVPYRSSLCAGRCRIFAVFFTYPQRTSTSPNPRTSSSKSVSIRKNSYFFLKNSNRRRSLHNNTKQTKIFLSRLQCSHPGVPQSLSEMPLGITWRRPWGARMCANVSLLRLRCLCCIPRIFNHT